MSTVSVPRHRPSILRVWHEPKPKAQNEGIGEPREVEGRSTEGLRGIGEGNLNDFGVGVNFYKHFLVQNNFLNTNSLEDKYTHLVPNFLLEILFIFVFILIFVLVLVVVFIIVKDNFLIVIIPNKLTQNHSLEDLDRKWVLAQITHFQHKG